MALLPGIRFSPDSSMRFIVKIAGCLLCMFAPLFLFAQNTEIDFRLQKNSLNLNSDSNSLIKVRHFILGGNRKTKSKIILREIPFKEGDSIPANQLLTALQEARQQVYNTTLFNEVKMNVVPVDSSTIDILIEVKERWYLFPLPEFQLVDRNLNEWLVKYKGDLSRVNYGIKFTHYNWSGRRDRLNITLLNGYTRAIAFNYNQPFSNPALTQGYSIGGGFTQTREVAYKTSYNNKLLFFNDGNFARKNAFVNASYTFRNAFKTRHIFGLSFNHLQVNDSILTSKYNPDFFNGSNSTVNYIDLYYTYQYIDVNNIAYPLKGTTGFITLSKRGFGFGKGVDLLTVEGTYNRYWSLPGHWYPSVQTSFKIKAPFKQAYINQRALGYGDAMLRGLDYYVIDGAAMGIVRTTLKKKICFFKISLPNKKSSKTRSGIPFTIFAKTFADIGYSYALKQYDTYLNNRLLYTGGFGIDILTLYDFNLRFDFCFNQLQQNGLFLHTQAGF